MQKLVNGKRFSTEEARGFLDKYGDVLLLFPENAYPFKTGIVNKEVSKVSQEQGLAVIAMPLAIDSLAPYSLEDINQMYGLDFVEEVIV